MNEWVHKGICTGDELFIGSKVQCILKFAFQKGEGEKREGVPILKKSTQNLSPKK